jgi:hypothetical protein
LAFDGLATVINQDYEVVAVVAKTLYVSNQGRGMNKGITINISIRNETI